VLGARKVSRGRKVSALRGLGLRKAYLTEGKVKDLDSVVPMMSGGGALSPEGRKALVAFLKEL
jgi:cytochrome c peroxidase